MGLNVFARLNSAKNPLVLLTISMWFGFATVLRLLVVLDLGTLLSRARFTEAWFARFWTFFGPLSTGADATFVGPVMATAHGRVLDVGPGTGLQVRYFDKSKVSKIYGVEPNAKMHAALRANVQAAGLADVYEIVGCGAEELASVIEKESVDCIVTVKVLCGVPQPERVLRELYSYLKPGGLWIVFEHVRNENDWITQKYQGLVQLIWPHLLGGCNINRPTKQLLLGSGEWSEVELRAPEEETPVDTIPHVMGRLVKAGGKSNGTPLPPPMGDPVTLSEHQKIRMWWQEKDMGYFVIVYCALSYCFWGFVEAMK